MNDLTMTATQHGLFITQNVTASGAGGEHITLATAFTNGFLLMNVEKYTLAAGNNTVTTQASGHTIDAGLLIGGQFLNLAGSHTATVSLTAGNLTSTSTGNLTVVATTGDNNIVTAGGSDSITGGTGSDVLTSAGGADFIYGDNAGTKPVSTVTIGGTFAAGNTITATVQTLSVSVTATTNAATTAGLLQAALSTRLGALATVTVSSNVVTITSLVDGASVVTSSSNGTTTAVAASTVTGTAGAAGTDTISAGLGDDGIAGGGGADSLSGGDGADVFFFLKGHSNLASMATITDYTRTGFLDRMFIGDIAPMAGSVTTVQTFAGTDVAVALDQAANNNTVNGGHSVFTLNGNEYIYVESNGGSTTYAAGDFVVKLTGTPYAAGSSILNVNINHLV